MVEMSASYKMSLRCELTHGPSGTKLLTDAPKDNMGQGESFSPTDLLGAALASCALITMGIVARKNGFEFGEASARVTKEMTATPPRKVARLPLEIQMPSGLSEESRTLLEAAAKGCPVARSLNSEIQAEIRFSYPD